MNKIDKKRILYIGFNKKYSNPGYEPPIDVLATIMDMDYFGPGFSTPYELDNGIEEYIKTLNLSYDYVICDALVFEYENIRNRKNRFGGTALFFENKLYDKYAPILKTFFLDNKYQKLLLSNWDYYNISTEIIDEIINNKIIIIGTDKSVMKAYAEDQSTYNTTNNWYDFSRRFPERIISSPHFLANYEFNRTPLFSRDIFFDVPGTEYAERKEVMRLTKLKRTKHFRLQKILNFIFFFLRRKPNRDILNFFNNRFNNKISNTKICYVSGSSLEYPIRKYFEIPGKGTLLVCSSFTGMVSLGFRNKVNCIILNELTEVNNILKNYNEFECQSIASNGLKLIEQKHSFRARVEQWKSSFLLIENGAFNGSTWVNGEYINL
jgi:hypothetical protein